MSVTTVLITGAAGRIGYALIPLVAGGSIFGHNQRIILKLFDIPEAQSKLDGVKMEIDDSNFVLLDNVVATTNAEEAFTGIDVAVLVGGFPRLPGMERRDLLIKNAESMKSQALALNTFSSPATKVLVVANPANTNCLMAIKAAPKIPAKNFTCLTRLDEERLRDSCAKKAGVALGVSIPARNVRDVFIFGNHSTTQVAYIDHGKVTVNEEIHEVTRFIANESEYEEVLSKVQNRGAAIIKALQVSSALSAAEAIAKHLRDWLGPQNVSHAFSMGVYSSGNSYGVPDDLVYSFPCERTAQGEYRVVDGLPISAPIRALLTATAAELLDEKEQIKETIASL